MEENKVDQKKEEKSTENTVEQEGVEQFNKADRDSMRAKVISWMKSHPNEVAAAKKSDVVIVPKQKRSFSWPWHKKTKKVTKTVVVAVSNKIPEKKPTDDKKVLQNEIVKLDTSSQKTPVKKEVVVDVKSTTEKTEGNTTDSKIDKNEPIVTNKAPSWPPMLGDNNSSEIIDDKKKVEDKQVEKTEVLLKNINEPLLDSGEEEFMPEHSGVVEQVEEFEHEQHVLENLRTTSSNIQVKEEPVKKITEHIEQKKRGSLNFKKVYVSLWIIFCLVTGVGVFTNLLFSTSTASFVSKFAPVPYALVGKTIVMQSSYDNELHALTTFQESQSANHLNAEDLQKQAQANVIKKAIVWEIANEEKIWVSQSDINAEYNDVVLKAGSVEQVESTVKKFWGWTIADYKRYGIRQQLLKKKVQQKLYNDPVLKNEVGEPGNITAFDRYLDSVSNNYKIILF